MKARMLLGAALAVLMLTAGTCNPDPPGNQAPSKPDLIYPNQRVDGVLYTSYDDIRLWASAGDVDGDSVSLRFRVGHWGTWFYESSWVPSTNWGALVDLPPDSTVASGLREGQTYILQIEARDEHGAISDALNTTLAIFTDYHPPALPGSYYDRLDLPSDFWINYGLDQASTSYLRENIANLSSPGTADCQTPPSGLNAQMDTSNIPPLGNVTGMGAALNSLRTLMMEIRVKEPGLADILRTAGMLCYRNQKSTSGGIFPGTVSNHSWGLAIDFKTVSTGVEGDLNGQASRYLHRLREYMWRAGWYWGAAFPGNQDNMHFETSRNLVDYWRFVGLVHHA